jgi:mRNA-degrading endonuclease toxin of MazEF toxin-antitoxin module
VALRRGEVRSYTPVLERPGQSLRRLIVSADPLNESDMPVVLGLQVVDRDPGSLLAVRLDGHGWAVVTTIEQVVKRRLGDVAGAISRDEQRAVDNALRAALEL